MRSKYLTLFIIFATEVTLPASSSRVSDTSSGHTSHPDDEYIVAREEVESEISLAADEFDSDFDDKIDSEEFITPHKAEETWRIPLVDELVSQGKYNDALELISERWFGESLVGVIAPEKFSYYHSIFKTAIDYNRDVYHSLCRKWSTDGSSAAVTTRERTHSLGGQGDRIDFLCDSVDRDISERIVRRISQTLVSICRNQLSIVDPYDLRFKTFMLSLIGDSQRYIAEVLKPGPEKSIHEKEALDVYTQALELHERIGTLVTNLSLLQIESNRHLLLYANISTRRSAIDSLKDLVSKMTKEFSRNPQIDQTLQGYLVTLQSRLISWQESYIDELEEWVVV